MQNFSYNQNDGYYYALLHLERRGLQEWGMGVMRTRTLDDPKSWRAWDGSGFNVQFIDPYKNPNADPAEHLCQPVSRDQIQKMHESLSFNTHFNKFLLVGTAGQYDPARGKVVWGFYYSLSDDLINWTPMKLLMEAKQPWDTRTPGEPLIYPSLIDPEDTSRNFEITGQRAYLYYVRWHPYTPANQGLDRDLVRVMIEFD
ncbi:MAG: hypothetical protein HY314_00315 [Acidobacteria bacterium]|nr:hypothetical protein [Acidobacteriota bacterium]